MEEVPREAMPVSLSVPRSGSGRLEPSAASARRAGARCRRWAVQGPLRWLLCGILLTAVKMAAVGHWGGDTGALRGATQERLGDAKSGTTSSAGSVAGQDDDDWSKLEREWFFGSVEGDRRALLDLSAVVGWDGRSGAALWPAWNAVGDAVLAPESLNATGLNVSDHCTWPGVYCDESDGRVSKLVLQSRAGVVQGAMAAVPGSIGTLSHLRHLELRDTAVLSPLPTQMGLLENMEVLLLCNCSLRGHALPSELLFMSSLRLLDLSGNRLDTFPPALQTCGWDRLAELAIDGNRVPLAMADSPWELFRRGCLGRLLRLSLDNSMLQGGLPESMRHLGSLQWLSIANNPELRRLPDAFGSMSQLFRLDASMTGLQDPLPESISQMCALDDLTLEGTLLVGPLPPVVSVAAHVEEERPPLKARVTLQPQVVLDATRGTLNDIVVHVTPNAPLSDFGATTAPGALWPPLLLGHERSLHVVAVGPVQAGSTTLSHVHPEDFGTDLTASPALVQNATFPVKLAFLASGTYVVGVDLVTVAGPISAYGLIGVQVSDDTGPLLPPPPISGSTALGSRLHPLRSGSAVVTFYAVREDAGSLTGALVSPTNLTSVADGPLAVGAPHYALNVTVPAAAGVKVAQQNNLLLSFARVIGGDEIAPLQHIVPYLGAAAHVQLVSSDPVTWLHTHATMSSSGGGHLDVCPTPSTFPPDLQMTISPTVKSAYHMFVQARIDPGWLFLGDLWIEVS